MTLARWPPEGLNSAAYASSIQEKKHKIKRSPTPDRPGPVSGASLPSLPDVLGESPRSTAEATGNRPDRDLSLPVSIPITLATDGTFDVSDSVQH